MGDESAMLAMLMRAAGNASDELIFDIAENPSSSSPLLIT
jgi:hypothetical protein